jgi:hypothetical protein
VLVESRLVSCAQPSVSQPRGRVDITKVVVVAGEQWMRAIKGLKKIGLMPVIVSARGHRRSVRSDDD